MIGKYPGDEKMKALLTQYYPGISFAEVRAATAGAVLTVETVQPSQLFAHLFGDEDKRPEFKDMDAAQVWYSCMMGLWNELADHQDPKRPFLFSEWPGVFSGGNEEMLLASVAREKEIAQFLWGLHAGATPFAEDFIDPTPETLKSWTPAFLEFTLRIMERIRKELEQGKLYDPTLICKGYL